MRRSTLAAIPLLLLALLSVGPAPASGQPPAPADDGPLLAGRNCGGTLLLDPGPPGPAPAQSSAGGWSIGGPIDPAASALRQIAPAVALDATGVPLYIWQEASDRDGGDIFVASGAPALAQGRRAVRVDDTASTPVEQAAPALAIGSDGAAFAVWQDRRDAPGVDELFFSRSPDGGQSWGANAQVHLLSRSYPNHRAPALLADRSGGMHLVYVGDGVSRDDIRYARYVGPGWSAPISINANLPGQRARPTLALASDGDLLAAWEDTRDGVRRIYVARLDLSGGAAAWGADVAATPRGLTVGRPSLALGSGGVVYLAYQIDPLAGGGIFTVASADGGASWGQPRRVDDNSGTATNPRLAVDSSGGVHCIWCRLSGSAGILTARSRDGGASWPAPTVLAETSGTAEPMALAADGYGRVFAAWSDSPNDLNPILYAAEWSQPRLYLPLLSR
jgi:hypothetical protein